MGAVNGEPVAQDRFWTRFCLPRPILGLAGLAVLVIFVMVGIEYIQLEEEWRQIRFEQSRIGDAKAEPPPHTVVLTQLQARARIAKTTPTRGMALEQLEWMRRVAERYAFAGTHSHVEALALNGEPRRRASPLQSSARSECARCVAKRSTSGGRTAKQSIRNFATSHCPPLAGREAHRLLPHLNVLPRRVELAEMQETIFHRSRFASASWSSPSISAWPFFPHGSLSRFAWTPCMSLKASSGPCM